MLHNKLNPKSKIAIVIDTPSNLDINNNQHCTDKNAQVFLGKLASVGIDYTEASYLSVSPVRHTTINRMTGKELIAWTAYLDRELQKISPNVIIAVGEMALRALTTCVNIEKYRGTPVECKLIEAVVVPFEHYDTYFSKPESKPLTDFYAQKVARYQHSNKMPNKDMTVHVTKDMEVIRDEFLNDGYLSNPDSVLGVDIECSSAEITCIGFAKEEDVAYVIPLVHMRMPEFVEALRTIDEVLRSPVKKIFQNGNFDIVYLGYYYNVKVNNFWWDTMLAWHSCFPNLPKGIDTISSVCTDEPYWKDDGKQWDLPYDQINWTQFFEYNGRDTANMLTIQKVEDVLLDLRDTRSIFQQEMDLCYPLIAMELDGVRIDQDKMREMQVETVELARKWQLFLDTLLGDLAVNVRSPKQLQKLLFDDLSLPKRVRKGKLTTDEDALLTLIPYNPIVIKAIMILKKIYKESSEYKVLINEDGKQRSTFKPAGTMTGRLASSTSITKSGTNFQNRAKKLRVFYVPDESEVV